MLTLTAALLALVAVPALVDLLGRTTGHPYGVPFGGIVVYVCAVMVGPLLLGLAVRHVWPGVADRLADPLAHIVFVVTVVAFAAELGPARQRRRLHRGRLVAGQPRVGMITFGARRARSV